MSIKSVSSNGKTHDESSNGNGLSLRQEIRTALKNDDMKLIDDLGAEATPRQIRNWISHLEELFVQKKERVRADVKGKVNEIMGSNSYTLEELFGARILPTTDELSGLADSRQR